MLDGDQPAASRLLRLRLPLDGRLPRSSMLAATTRAALLADLALSGALTTSDTGLEVDTTPTGYDPADRLLAGVVAQPDQTMDWWVRRGPDSVRAVVADLLERGTWTHWSPRPGRRYRDTEAAAVRADAAHLEAVLDGATPDSPATAVLATLLCVIGTDRIDGDRLPGRALSTACGRAAWLVDDLAAYLLRYRQLLGAVAADARIALSVNFIS